MLSVKQLNYTVKGKKILQGIDFKAMPGSLIAIIGPNGAGKTTLLNSIANEVLYDGDIVFKDKSIKKWNIKQLAQHRAKLSQHFAQDIPLSVQEVVLMGRYPYFNNIPSRNDLYATVQAMEATEMISYKKMPYNPLSGGEKQRVHLSRIFAQLNNNHAHKLLLLDEPLNHLDVYHQHTLLSKIKTFVIKGRNIGILVLHNLNLAAQFANILLLLKNGKLVVQGSPGEVLTSHTISETYNFPCRCITHPNGDSPFIIFGKQEHEKQNIH